MIITWTWHVFPINNLHTQLIHMAHKNMLSFKTVASEKNKGKRNERQWEETIDPGLSLRGEIIASDYLKLKDPFGTTGAWWDVLIRWDVLRRNPQRRAPSTVTHHLNMKKHDEQNTNSIHMSTFPYVPIFCFTWCGSGAIFFLNLWNTLLSSVSCIAISSRSVSVRAE